MPTAEEFIEFISKKAPTSDAVRSNRYWLNEWYKEYSSTDWADWMDLHETFIRDEEWLKWLRKYRGEIER